MAHPIRFFLVYALLLVAFQVLAGCTGSRIEYSSQEVASGCAPGVRGQAVPPAANPAEVIAGLEAQPAPDGVASDVWQKLTAELVRVLAERASGKLASAAPDGEGGAAVLSYVAASTSLQWLYVNPGDYDQNGVVSVSDLTPLGVHFGETSQGGPGQPFDPLSEQWAIDGDGNGVIDLGDITPIGANFGVMVEGYRVYYSVDEDDVPDMPDAANGPGATGLVLIPLWSANQYQGRLRFSHQINPSLTPTHYWVRPCHGTDEGAASNSVEASSAAPVALLEADIAEGPAPLHVVFDAGGSTDPDGFIARYDFDFDGNGAWDAYDAASSIAHDYSDSGVYTALVRVTDNDFAQDTATLEITVTVPGNEPPVADLSADVTDGDAPLHVYFDAQDSVDTDGEIVKYEWDFEGTGEYILTGNDPTIDHIYDTGYYTAVLRVTDDRGDTDTATLEIKARGWVKVDITESGVDPTLAIVDGNPAISFLDQDVYGDEDVIYLAKSSTSLGDNPGDWQTVAVESHDSLHFVRLAVVHGNPAISYFDHIEDSLRFGRSTTTTGESAEDWSFTTVADGIGMYLFNVGHYQHLAEVAGKAAICYFDCDDEFLKYIRSSTVSGSGPGDWSEPVIIDDSVDENVDAYLAMVNGNPAISYYERSMSSLKYVRSATPHGTSAGDWQVVTVASGNNMEDWGTGLKSALAVVSGNPAICYMDSDNNYLCYARANSYDGTDAGFWPEFTIDDSPINSKAHCLGVVDGNPAVFLISNANLYYTRADNSTGTGSSAWPARNLVDDDPERSVKTVSMAVVNGHPAVTYNISYPYVVRYAILY